MDAGRIRQEAERLPLGESSLDVPTEDEVWADEENGVHFVFSRSTPPEPGFEQLSLSLAGPTEARSLLVSDFCAVFGQPTDVRTITQGQTELETVSWVVLARDFGNG